MTDALRVVDPGLLTTIQDLGRLSAIASGVPPGGAMDRFAHQAANLLAGNEPNDASLECTMRGPHLVAERPCVIAITGADFDPHVNGKPAAMWAALFLAAGTLEQSGIEPVPFLPAMSLAPSQLVWLLLVPLAAGLIALATTRLSVLAVLNRNY